MFEIEKNTSNNERPQKIQIITASQIHLPELVDLFEEYRQFYRMPPNKAAAFRFLTLRLQYQDTRLYLAQHPKHPTPFSIVGFVHLFPSFSSLAMRRLWILNDLYVYESYRGCGVGQLLIQKAILLAKETQAQGIFLQTEIQNTRAQKFYVKNGFIKDEVNSYYHWYNPELEKNTPS
ncbi:MAG: GNAT family N-acetyltransferase [Bacteroidia bacterium]|nr:GNAT family N-acetyltransferase [Bacteroidia bacterium]MDW8157322.1 GNAT family N-acetyltransferase [Bacteroidia bacterium]